MSEQIPADNATILVVDDIPTNLGVLTIGLGIHGYNVKVAQSGRQALAQVREISPSLILLDVRMPDLDGYEVCERLKADPNLRDIPVIFLSAQGETIDKVRGFQAGGVDYLTKPLQMEEVLAHVDVHITLFQQRKAIEDLLAEQVKAKTAERQQRLMVNALLDSALVVNSTLQLNEVLERILKNVGQVVAHDMAMIILIEGDLGWVASFRSTIPNHWIVPTPKFPGSNGFCGREKTRQY